MFLSKWLGRIFKSYKKLQYKYAEQVAESIVAENGTQTARTFFEHLSDDFQVHQNIIEKDVFDNFLRFSYISSVGGRASYKTG